MPRPVHSSILFSTKIKFYIITIILLPILLVGFQNCGSKFEIDASILSQSSEIDSSDDTSRLNPNDRTPSIQPKVPVFENHFKTVDKLGTDIYAPKSDQGQRVEMVLHPSGGGTNITFGDWYQATGDITLGYKDEMPFEFHVQNSGNYGGIPFIGIRPRDYINKENGNMLETWWFGYMHKTFPLTSSSKVYAFDYTEKRLDQLYQWFFKNYPQANPKKIILRGQSMGCWGSMTYGLRRVNQYAAIFCTLPRWRQTDMATLDGSTISNDMTLPNGENFINRMDMVSYINNPSNEIPFVAWSIGKNDGFATWESQVDAVKALRATKRGFVFSWNNGNHSEGVDAMTAVTATYTPEDFELGKGYPIFMNSSLDNDVNTDLIGGINLGFKWRNMIETDNGFEIEISNTLGNVSVDVLPHSHTFLKKVVQKNIYIPSGQWVKVTFN
ncbi:MAG: hypothetical protein L6Q37_03045 [Bdellovibrionaceae bacterium]|nr:hypothetical protein [Pseudobdellovibrionaceae bacterium]NUM57589.1 hypothetical protein [Pseudobdellovibrionaceae bacterium]